MTQFTEYRGKGTGTYYRLHGLMPTPSWDDLIIRSIALRRRSPNRISRIKAPVDQLLIPIRRNLANNIVIFAIRWAGKSNLNTDETLDSLFGPRHLRVDLLRG